MVCFTRVKAPDDVPEPSRVVTAGPAPPRRGCPGAPGEAGVRAVHTRALRLVAAATNADPCARVVALRA